MCTSMDSYGTYGQLNLLPLQATHLGLFARKEWQQSLMIVHLNVVVLRLPAVNLSLDLVTVIVEYEKIWLDSSSNHGANLLQSLRSTRTHLGIFPTHKLE